MIKAGFDMLDEVGVRPVDGVSAVVLIKDLEQIRRRGDYANIKVISEIERYGFHSDDGYASPKAMVRHHARLSNSEAVARSRAARMCVELPEVDAACRRGAIPVDNLRQLGRLFANPRVANEMMEQEPWLLGKALELRPAKFGPKMKIWEDLRDADGPEPEAERLHRNRRFRFGQGFDKAWGGEHQHGSMEGASMHEIFLHYLEAETLADWEKAREEFGEDAAECNLDRTMAQRSADALFRIYQDAASNPAGPVPTEFVHNLVWSQETFEYYLNHWMGAEPDPMNPDLYRCETLDGMQVNPVEAMASAVVSKLRRVVVDEKGVVIDLGRARNYTRGARAAVKLGSTECIWPSCHVPSSKCETDHVQEHSRNGSTNPENGAALCGKHNRWKQKGFTVHRDPGGNWHVHRPDGTEIDP